LPVCETTLTKSATDTPLRLAFLRHRGIESLPQHGAVTPSWSRTLRWRLRRVHAGRPPNARRGVDVGSESVATRGSDAWTPGCVLISEV
jgi:hypothetical protein